MKPVVYLEKNQNNCPFCGTTFEMIHGELRCPNCNALVKDISRITGYLSFDERFGTSKVSERTQRVDHNNEHKNNYLR